MKWLLIVIAGSLLCSLGDACGQMMEVHADYNLRGETVEVFSAPIQEVEKTRRWKLEHDAPFLSHAELIAIARKNLSFDTTQYRFEEVAGLDWRRTTHSWLLTVHFRIQRDPNGLIRDGSKLVAVRLLPNGVPLTRTVRPMTDYEKGIPSGEAAAPPDPFEK